MKNPFFVVIILLILSGFYECSSQKEEKVLLKVIINDSLYNTNVSGKLIFLFHKDTSQQLFFGVSPFKPHPVFTYNISNHNLKDTIFIAHLTDEWCLPFDSLHGLYGCRVIFDINNQQRSSFVSKNNGYSSKQLVDLDKENDFQITFNIDNAFMGWKFSEKENIKEVRIKSKQLTKFWKKDIYIESAIVLPDNYNPIKQYKFVYVFPGFGSNHAAITYGDGQIERYGMNTIGDKKIFIFMNGEFFQGYHHFADSDNNGPWENAFISEFVPLIDSLYGVRNDSIKRYLMGQSSGAWTALWLQLNYPEYFEHAFAASPDPIDFRAHGHDIYKERNYYFPEDADSSDISKGENTKLYCILENVLGEFGQIRTWEATFSPRSAKGAVVKLFDRQSGVIKQEVVEAWRRFDMSFLITENPQKYKKIVSESLHIFVSKDDPYRLNRSVEMFEGELKNNGINYDIKYYEGLGHNVWTDQLRQYIHSIIDD